MTNGHTQRDVFISTASFLARDLDEILELCNSYRITALELSAIQCYDLEHIGSTSYPKHFLVHNYFPPPQKPFLLNLASQNEEALATSREHCRAAVDLSAQLGASVYAVHAGYAADISPDKLGDPVQQGALPADTFASYTQMYAALLESARILTKYGKERRVRFLIENHVLSAQSGEAGRRLLPMVTAEELSRLARDVNDSNFGILVDVGHLNVSARTLGLDRHRFIDTLAPHIAAFHLSDNDGVTDQHLPFANDAWFLPRLRDVPDATVTLELTNLEIDQMLSVRDLVLKWL